MPKNPRLTVFAPITAEEIAVGDTLLWGSSNVTVNAVAATDDGVKLASNIGDLFLPHGATISKVITNP